MDNDSDEERENMSHCDTGNYVARFKYMIQRAQVLQQNTRNKSENEYSITSKDDMIDSKSDIDSNMDTDNDGDEYIPLYDNKNDYNPNFDCNYVNRRSDHTAIEYIH